MEPPRSRHAAAASVPLVTRTSIESGAFSDHDSDRDTYEDKYSRSANQHLSPPRRRGCCGWPLCVLLLSIVFFVLSALNVVVALRGPKVMAEKTAAKLAEAAAAAGTVGASVGGQKAAGDCGRTTSVWSPLLDAIEYEEVDFKNNFTQESEFRGPPTPELEGKWQQLVFKHAVRIPADKVHSLNRDPVADRLARAPPNPGSSPSQPEYKALIDVFHQLHCLNRIRQYTWYLAGAYVPDALTDEKHPEYDPSNAAVPGDFRTSAVANRVHIDHCIETLRMTLMCHADVTPVLIVEDERSPNRGLRADFSSRHMCRNFEKISTWMDMFADVP